jgi:hypothetical protein
MKATLKLNWQQILQFSLLLNVIPGQFPLQETRDEDVGLIKWIFVMFS